MTTTATFTIGSEIPLAPAARPERRDRDDVSVGAPGAVVGRADAASADDARACAIESVRIADVRAEAERRLQNVRGASPFRGAM